MVIILLFPFLLLFHLSPANATPTEYDIAVTYDDKEHQIHGFEEIAFVNDGPVPLSEIYLLLYPNRYLRKEPEISPIFYRQAYPVKFNPGGIQVTSIRDIGGSPLPHSLNKDDDKSKKETLMRVQLPKPIPPHGTVRFIVHFTTTLPEKRGIFGYYRDVVTLQGGWHPYLPRFEHGRWEFHATPPKSRFRIHLTLDERLRSIASDPPKLVRVTGTDLTLFMEGELPFFSLSIGEKTIRHVISVDGVKIIYYPLLRNQSDAQAVAAITKEAVSFFQEQYRPTPDARFTLTDAYLFQDLATAGSRILYINDRFLKVASPLRRFHEENIARGIFFLLRRERRPQEEGWVIEGLAHLDAKKFIQQKYGKESRLADWLKPFGFIPLVDQVLYSKSLPLRQVYFVGAGRPILEEDIRFFNHPRMEGKNIFYHLSTLLGKEAFARSVKAYLEQDQREPPPSFRQILLKVPDHHEIDQLIDRWLERRPILDFGIEEILRDERDNAYHTSIIINKVGEGIEPLEMILYEENGSKIPLVWDGTGETHEVVLTTPSRIETVVLDPNKFAGDPNRLNNRSPPSWKVLLNDFSVNYDFQTRFLSYRAGFLFQRRYDTKSWIRLFFSRSDTGKVSHLGYTQTLKSNHVVTTGVTYENRKMVQDTLPEVSAGILNLGYAVNYPNIPLLEESIQRLTGTYPKINVSLNYNQQFTAGLYDNSFLAKLDLRRVFSFSRFHEISTRIFIGQSFGRLFEDNRFFLGGSTGMRGYTTLAFEGENMSLFSVEYRFPLLRETDVNFMGVASNRALQVGLFADTGTVTDSHNVFQVSQYKYDVGAGIRFFIDLFGLYPAIIRFDVAVPIDAPIEGEKKPHYYLTAGQSF